MIIIKTRSEVKVKVTVTRKWYTTLRHPKMYPHTKFGIPNSKNIGDMDRTQKRDGRTDGLTDGLTDGRTVRLLYASQSSFGGIKRRGKCVQPGFIQGSLSKIQGLLMTILQFSRMKRNGKILIKVLKFFFKNVRRR